MNRKILVFLTIFGFSLAELFYFDAEETVSQLFPEGLTVPLDKDLVEEFLVEYKLVKDIDDAAITALVNEYADKLFANIEKFAIKNGLDPVPLSNFSQKFLTASVTLTNGSLKGISSTVRNGDIELSYSHAENKLSMDFPINLRNLNFTYDFHVVLLLVGPSGKMTGKIKDFAIDLKLNFDFDTLNATIYKISSPGMGSIEVTLDGHGIIDSVINILSKFVTSVLHPFLEGFIVGIIKKVAAAVVESVNEGIDKFLHPNGTVFIQN